MALGPHISGAPKNLTSRLKNYWRKNFPASKEFQTVKIILIEKTTASCSAYYTISTFYQNLLQFFFYLKKFGFEIAQNILVKIMEKIFVWILWRTLRPLRMEKQKLSDEYLCLFLSTFLRDILKSLPRGSQNISGIFLSTFADDFGIHFKEFSLYRG